MNSENFVQIKKASLVFRAINHKLRQDIYQYLRRHPKTCVTQLYREFGLEQSVASQHLAILREQGFVITEKKDRFVYYSANEERLDQVKQLSDQLLN